MWLLLAKILAAAVVYGAAIEPRLLLTEHEPAAIPRLPNAWEGKQIAVFADMQVGMWWANRDAARGSHMDDFDPARPSVGHLAFGHGIHRCIGAELARMELRAAFPALLGRFPGVRLAVEPDQLTFREASIVYGLDALPVMVR